MDRADGEWALSDYVQKGIEVLDNDTGFFMMCEGGKIDWACHANDAGTKRKEFQYILFGDDVMDEFGRFQPSPGRSVLDLWMESGYVWSEKYRSRSELL